MNLGALGKMRRRLDQGCDRSLEPGKFESDLAHSRSLHFLHWFRRGVLAPVLQAGLQVEQPLPRMDDLDKLLAGRIVDLAPGLAEGLGKQAIISASITSFLATARPIGRSCAPLGVDDPHLDIGLAQRLGPVRS